MAWRSYGLIVFSPVRTRRPVPGSIRFLAVGSGTSFTQMAIFTRRRIATGRSRAGRQRALRQVARARLAATVRGAGLGERPSEAGDARRGSRFRHRPRDIRALRGVTYD